MTSDLIWKRALIAVSVLLLAACSSGSSSTGGGGGTTNSAPTASAGADQSVDEFSAVTLTGSGTDPNAGDTLTYAWTQTVGTSVTIANSNTAIADFTAPDVTAGNPETLTFRLTVSDGSLTNSDTVDVTVSEPAVTVSVAGRISYEFVPPNANCNGLNLDNPQARPIRAATVQLLDAADNVLGEMAAGGDGSYSFSNIDTDIDVRIRVRAELKSSGPATWDVEVRDNVDDPNNPLPLASRPLYVTQWPLFNTGTSDTTDADFTALTGWDGSAYTGTRAAAPFAILDSIYSGISMIASVDPNAIFPPHDAFWSVNNTRVIGVPTNVDIGELSSTHYNGGLDSLFLLGDATVDTEEFDDHVVMHEWGHYFEDNFSRSDSIGGRHVFGSSLDARLAFGEGFATAFAGIVLQDPVMCNTRAPLLTGGFSIDAENFNSGLQGWFNEGSVATLLYDLWDSNVDGTDNSSIGFAPIFNTLTGPQRTTPAFTTIFSFAAELRPMLDPTQRAFVDSQLARENIESTNIDIWATTQDNITAAPNQSRDVLPLYTTLPTDGTVINLCANSDYESGRDGNKLAEYRYLRFTTTSSSAYNVTITTTTPTPPTSDPAPDPPDVIRDQSDPDMFIFRDGQFIVRGTSGEENEEIFATPLLSPGTYVADLQEWRYDDDDASSDFPEQICFDISMSPL